MLLFDDSPMSSSFVNPTFIFSMLVKYTAPVVNVAIRQKENVTLDAQYVFDQFRLKTKSSWLQVAALYMNIKP